MKQGAPEAPGCSARRTSWRWICRTATPRS